MSVLKKILRRNPARPTISLVVVIYKMPEQARKTLLSLASGYQLRVDAQDYEIIAVENSSDAPLGKQAVTSIAPNIRYFYREETLPSPVPAALFGVAQCRSELLGIMIDGARMASPGLVDTVIRASAIHPRAVISVPGYHLGETVQQEAIHSGYNEQEEARLLHSINWPEDGYKLFDIACFSGSSRPGFFRPNAESNCLCLPRSLWNELGGLDPAFTETGGGQANPDLYKRACELPGTRLIVTPGEGTFHQFHGGVTTGTVGDERERHMQNHFEQYKLLRGQSFRPPLIHASLFGEVPENALRFLQHSIKVANENPWPQN